MTLSRMLLFLATMLVSMHVKQYPALQKTWAQEHGNSNTMHCEQKERKGESDSQVLCGHICGHIRVQVTRMAYH